MAEMAQHLATELHKITTQKLTEWLDTMQHMTRTYCEDKCTPDELQRNMSELGAAFQAMDTCLYNYIQAHTKPALREFIETQQAHVETEIERVMQEHKLTFVMPRQ